MLVSKCYFIYISKAHAKQRLHFNKAMPFGFGKLAKIVAIPSS